MKRLWFISVNKHNGRFKKMILVAFKRPGNRGFTHEILRKGLARDLFS